MAPDPILDPQAVRELDDDLGPEDAPARLGQRRLGLQCQAEGL